MNIEARNPYDPYEVQANGLPPFGQVVLDFIKINGWTVEQFGVLYGKAIRKKQYTKVRIYQMINDNSFPTDKTRRFIIASLLRIPAFLLGVEALEDLLESCEIREYTQKSTISLLTYEKNIDLSEYQNFLTDCYTKNRAYTAHDLINEILYRIYGLHNKVLYVYNPQKEQMYKLLCEFHILLGKIECDQQHYEQAIDYLTKAVRLAGEKKFATLYAVALLQRGIALREQGNMRGRDKTEKLLRSAMRDFDATKRIENRIDAPLKAAILMASGDAQAYDAYISRSFRDIGPALHASDSVYKLMQHSDMVSDGHFVRFNEERFHLAIASTLIDINHPKNALEHLDLLLGNIHSGKRRSAYLNVLLAQAYMRRGFFPVAVSCAQEGLSLAKEIHSTVNIARIAKIYDDLRASEYGNDMEVAELGIEIMQAQHPYLFT